MPGGGLEPPTRGFSGLVQESLIPLCSGAFRVFTLTVFFVSVSFRSVFGKIGSATVEDFKRWQKK
jgi:hypothetical protein